MSLDFLSIVCGVVLGNLQLILDKLVVPAFSWIVKLYEQRKEQIVLVKKTLPNLSSGAKAVLHNCMMNNQWNYTLITTTKIIDGVSFSKSNDSAKKHSDELVMAKVMEKEGESYRVIPSVQKIISKTTCFYKQLGFNDTDEARKYLNEEYKYLEGKPDFQPGLL